MLFRRISMIKYLVATSVGIVFFSEIFVYYVQPALWPVLECSPRDSSCTKILFIADPQIQGDDAAPSPLHQIYNWDSDRFLMNTFRRAVNTFKPHILVFLGDLMDEGSTCTLKQYHTYAKRLFEIFTVNFPVWHIWLPGDNDIGGDHESVKQDKVEEFEKVFSQQVVSVMDIKNITFYKVNVILHLMPDLSDLPEDNSSFKVVLSHWSLGERIFGNQVKYEINPDIMFCGDKHESKYVKYDRQKSLSHPILEKEIITPLHIVFSDEFVHEIVVPTCSYRMGTEKIGFGAAVFEHENREMRYAVLWSPSRFRYLFVYLVFGALIIFYSVTYCTVRLISKCLKYAPKTSIQSKSDKEPLLS